MIFQLSGGAWVKYGKRVDTSDMFGILKINSIKLHLQLKQRNRHYQEVENKEWLYYFMMLNA